MNFTAGRIVEGKIDITPSEAGFDPQHIEQLDRHFSSLVDSRKVHSASYLLSRDGEIFAWKSMGPLTYHENSPEFAPDSLRDIASITKVFTSVAVLKLIQEGKLYLDQPVATVLDEFNTEMHKKITIFHLLTHTSGICPSPGYFLEPYHYSWWQGIKENGDFNWIKLMLAGPSRSKPGECWSYSSAGFALLGEIIRRVTGIDGEEYVRENVVNQLGMSDTYFDVPDEKKHRVCFINKDEEEWFHKSEKREDLPPRTAGGLFSTLSDLNRIGTMLINMGTFDGKRILGRNTVEAMTRNQLTNIPAYYWGADYDSFPYGLGLHVRCGDLITPGTFSHEGAGRSALYMDPVKRLVAAYFVPCKTGWLPESIICPKAIIWSGLL